jgi:hypothetical protein
MDDGEFKTWVWKNFTDKSSYDLFVVPSFPSSISLYKTGIVDSFLATIINGRVNRANFNAKNFPAEYEYDALIRHLRYATEKEASRGFYFLDHDDAWGELSSVWQWDQKYSTRYLSYFEDEPAEEAGAAHLGIVGDSKKWMLLHDYYPGNYFEISFYGEKVIVDKLRKELDM